MKTIVGLFDSRHQAEATVQDLERAGYSRDRVSVVAGKAPAGADLSPDSRSETATRAWPRAPGPAP